MAGPSNLDSIENSAQRVRRALENFERALDHASNEAVDKAVDSLKELVGSSDLLSDKLKAEAKDVKGVMKAMGEELKALTSRSVELQKAQAELVDMYEEVQKDATRTNALEKKYGAIQRKLKDMGIRADHDELAVRRAVEDALEKNKAAVEQNTAAMEAHADKVNEVNRDLNKVGARFGKTIDNWEKGLLGTISRTATFGTALEAAGDAARAIYKQQITLINRGMGTMLTQIKSYAFGLRMSSEELMQVIDKNRDTILALGGGSEGLSKFYDVLNDASNGLEIFGKDGKKIAAQFYSTFNRAGMGKDFVKNSKKINDQFRVMNATMGTTSDEFAEMYDELLSSQQLQAKVNLGDTKGAQLMTQEYVERQKNLAAMGLSTKQIVEFNKKLEDLYNPQKNRQAENMRQRVMGRLGIQATINNMQANGSDADKETAKTLQAGLDSGQYDELMRHPKTAADAKNADFLMASAKMKSYNADIRKGDNESFENLAGVEAVDRSSNFQVMQSAGETLLKADVQGLSQRGANRSKTVNAVAGAGGKLNPDGSVGTSAMGKVLITERTAVEQVTSVLENGFTPALKAAALAALAFAGPAALGRGIGAAAGAARAGAGALGSGAASLGSGFAALGGGGAAGAALATGGVLAAGAAGYGAGKLMNYGWEKATGNSFGSSLYNKFGDDDKVAAMLKGTPVTKMPSMAKGKAGKNQQSKSNEAMMDQALTDAGITDPSQKAILMGQLAHESGGFHFTKELGSGAKYEGRRDLGNTQFGDGDRFKGRGFIQLTGRSNYEKAGRALGLDLVNHPELAEKPDIASKIAVWYLQNHKNRSGQSVADMAASGDLQSVTKMINGGMNGYDDRVQRTQAYLSKYSDPMNQGGLTSPGTMVAGISKSPISASAIQPSSATTVATAATTAAALSSRPKRVVDRSATSQDATASTQTADAGVDDSLVLMKEQTAILKTIASNTAPRLGSESAKVDKRTALEQG